MSQPTSRHRRTTALRGLAVLTLGVALGLAARAWAQGGLPTVQLNQAIYPVPEGVNVPVNVTLSAASSQPVTVNYTTMDGTATAGQDYTTTTGQFTFAPGQTSGIISVPVLMDGLPEPDETFFLMLSAPINATLGSPSTVTLTITGDPGSSVTVQFASASYSVNEGAGTAILSVMLSGAASQVVTVSYSSSNGTAVAPGDYTAVSGMLTFPVGTTSQTITVPILDDTEVESSESFTLALTNPTGAQLGSPIGAMVAIADNDVCPPP